MQTLREQLSAILGDAFAACDYDRSFGAVTVSDRPDLCQFQSNGAMAAAKTYQEPPRDIAERTIAHEA